MNDVARSVERLTETHTVHLDGAEYECAALIAQLRDARTSSLGAGGGGGSGDGGLINVAAFTLWEQIDGVARAWLREWRRDHQGELADVVQRLPAAIQAEHVNGTVDEGKIEDALFDHVLMEPNGGTSSWSWCECSCGFMVRREGVTRDYVEKLARKHQVRAVVEAIGGESRG